MLPLILFGAAYLIGRTTKEETEFADGGMMAKGGSVNDDLENFDIFKLDDFEYMQYNHFIEKSKVSKKEALEILINNVEGDYSQLSPKLRAIAKRHKMAEGGMMAKGGGIEEGDVVIVKSENLKAEVTNVGTDFITVEFIGKRPEGGDKRGTYKKSDLKKYKKL